MILPHVAGPRMYPHEKFQTFAYPKDVVGLNHRHVWVDTIFEGEKTSDGFHYAAPLSETVQLGNVAARFPGETLEWDAKKMVITRGTDSAAAQAMLKREYRNGLKSRLCDLPPYRRQFRVRLMTLPSTGVNGWVQLPS